METTQKTILKTPKVLVMARGVSCVAARGTATRGTAARRTVTGTSRRSVPASMGFGSVSAWTDYALPFVPITLSLCFLGGRAARKFATLRIFNSQFGFRLLHSVII